MHRFESGKPTLPREVACALERLRTIASDDFILWNSSREDAEMSGGDWKTINQFVNRPGNSLVLSDALRFGYIVGEPSILAEIKAIAEDCGNDRERMYARLTDLFETRLEQERK